MTFTFSICRVLLAAIASQLNDPPRMYFALAGAILLDDPLVNTNWVRINTSALGARLPTVYNWRENVEAGGLMSYGANFPDTFRRSAELIDKFCARPSQPTSRSDSRPNSTSP